MVTCAEKTLIAASMIFGGLTFLMPSLVTCYQYITKWIPEEPDPNRRNQMKIVFVGSIIIGAGIVVGGVYYLKREKCI